MLACERQSLNRNDMRWQSFSELSCGGNRCIVLAYIHILAWSLAQVDACMADTARGIPRMSSGTQGKSPGASDDGESSARARAPPDVAPKLAKLVAVEATKKQWIRYGEKGRESAKKLKKLTAQKTLIRGAYRLQRNMCYSKKTIKASMKIVRDQVTFKLGKHEEDWMETCALRIFTMFTHVNVALTRPTRPRWLIELLDLKEEPKTAKDQISQKLQQAPEGKKKKMDEKDTRLLTLICASRLQPLHFGATKGGYTHERSELGG